MPRADTRSIRFVWVATVLLVFQSVAATSLHAGQPDASPQPARTGIAVCVPGKICPSPGPPTRLSPSPPVLEDGTGGMVPDIPKRAADDGFPAGVLLWGVVLLLLAAALLYLTRGLRSRPAPAAAPEVLARRHPASGGDAGLRDLMDLYLGGEEGPPLWAAGDASRKVLRELGEDRATSFLATLFWRVLNETPALRSALEAAGASRLAVERPDTLLVPHGAGTRYDLVVFDPSPGASEPSISYVAPTREDLARTWEQIVERDLVTAGLLRRLPPILLADALSEVAEFTKFGLVVAPQPEIVLTHCPSPAWAVGCAGQGSASTAGVVAVDAQGRKGVTVAEHAVRGCKEVLVNGRRGRVVSTQPIQDSCFVEVELDPADVAGRSLKPLTNASPRQNEAVEFDGLQSGRTAARVSGWDPTILTVEPYVQNKITTDAVTMPGDSGAALVSADGSVLGFSFYVTGVSFPFPFSCWIWAESVFLAHGLHRSKEG